MNDINETVECVLDGLNLAWKRRETAWVILPAARVPCEIDIVAADDRVSIQNVLASWDDITEQESAALALLLQKASAEQPGTRFEMVDQRILVIVEVPVGLIERRLSDGIARVIRATRLLLREVAILLDEKIAERYLSFFAAS